MAPGPVTTVVSTVAAAVSLCGLPFVWERMPLSRDSTQQATPSTPATEWSWEPESSGTLSSSLAHLVPHRPAEPSVGQSMPAVQQEAREQIWNAFDAWGLGPLFRERLSLLLRQCGLSGFDAMIPEVPGILLLIVTMDAALFLLLLCFKIFGRCRRSQKPLVPTDEMPGSSKAVDQSKHMARVPTPSRAKKPTMSQPCPPVPQPAGDDVMDLWFQQQEEEERARAPAVAEAASPSVTEDTPRKVRGRGFVRYQSPKQDTIFPRRLEKDPVLSTGAAEFVPGEKVHVQYQ